ncbi:MAG: hypothetical protein ACRCX8_13825 [Sarcina sp.]
MFNEIYKHLKENKIDVYSIGQHKWLCENPYVVIKENGTGEIVGTSLANDTVELMIYFPLGRYSELSAYVLSIRELMKLKKAIRRVYDASPVIIDDDKNAYMTSLYYRKIKTKEGA